MGSPAGAQAADAMTSRADIATARGELERELDTLEASARAAIDIPARVRRDPVKAAGVAGGAAFLAVGGPRRALRFARRQLRGAPEPLPKELLPEQVERVVRSLGEDGKAVRAALDREFSDYLAGTRKERERRGFRAAAAQLFQTASTPIVRRAALNAAERLFNADEGLFGERLQQVRRRNAERASSPAPSDTGPASRGSGPGAGAAAQVRADGTRRDRPS